MFPNDFVCLSHCYIPGCFFVTVDAWIINNIFDYNLSITVHVMQVINFRSLIHNTTSQSTRATADHDYDIPLFIFTTIAICQGKGDGICVLNQWKYHRSLWYCKLSPKTSFTFIFAKYFIWVCDSIWHWKTSKQVLQDCKNVES